MVWTNDRVVVAETPVRVKLIIGVGFFALLSFTRRSIYLPQLSRLGLSTNSSIPSKQDQLIGNHTLFFCGWGVFGVENYLFPEYVHKRNWTIMSNATSDDLMLNGMFGPCAHSIGDFPGKILHVNGEPHDRNFTGERQYQIGHHADDGHHMMRVHYISLLFSSTSLSTAQREWIWNPSHKKKSRKTHFLIYVAKNCHYFRDNAFVKLASVQAPAHQGGRCPRRRIARENVTKVDVGSRDDLFSNSRYFADYRFCLVLENTKLDGYITEKILLAFMGGCIPIYWGTREVFNIFNLEAFVYYDPENPQTALDRVRYLEYNNTAYDEVMTQPILANGNATLEDYFSLMDEFGGKMKRKIRHLLGL